MTLHHIGRRLWYSSWLLWRRTVFWSGAIAVALVAIGFAWAATSANRVLGMLLEVSPYALLVLTPLGLWLSLTLTRRFFPGAEGSGIPQTIAAVQLTNPAQRAAILSMRIACGKIVLTVLALCVGASVGREGPTVQIGAAIMQTLGAKLRLTRQEVQRGLIIAGGAAGVAAAFDTPLAGVVFAIEELSRSFEVRTSGLVFSGVILAGITSLALLGNYHYFGHTSVPLELAQAWLPVVICGIVGGLLGGLFSQTLVWSSRHGLPGPLGRLWRQHPERFAALCGLTVAVIGLLGDGTTYGTGYAQAQSVIHGATLPWSFVPLKMLATVVSYVSGIPGGLFSPSLAVGAGLGGEVAAFLPSSPTAAVVLLGMVGYFSGVVQAPITAVIIVLEMTDNSEMTIPLMATAVIAFGASKLICPNPLYKALAENFLSKLARRPVTGASRSVQPASSITKPS